MKTFAPKQTQIILLVLLVGLASLACVLSQSPALTGASKTTATPPAAAKVTMPVAQTTASPANSQDEIVQPDPLDHLLALHSIQINLGISQPDGGSSSIQIATDQTGNMDVKFIGIAPAASDLPKGFDLKALKTDSELLVVGGKAYLHNDQDPNWMSSPMDDNYPQSLAQELHGMDGPALWLNILPPGSIQPAGQETVGGFAVDKYVVNGKIDNQVISGTLWEEPQSDALIQADLHVPGALLSDPGQPQPGELHIVLKVQKADVPAITLPPAPPATAEPTTAP